MAELETKKEFVAPAPEYTKTAESRRQSYQQMIRSQQTNERDNLVRKRTRLAASILAERNKIMMPIDWKNYKTN